MLSTVSDRRLEDTRWWLPAPMATSTSLLMSFLAMVQATTSTEKLLMRLTTAMAHQPILGISTGTMASHSTLRAVLQLVSLVTIVVLDTTVLTVFQVPLRRAPTPTPRAASSTRTSSTRTTSPKASTAPCILSNGTIPMPP